MPAFCRAAKVPPVDSRVTPRALSARANSTRPDLSETDRSARRIGIYRAGYPLAAPTSIDSVPAAGCAPSALALPQVGPKFHEIRGHGRDHLERGAGDGVSHAVQVCVQGVVRELEQRQIFFGQLVVGGAR